MLENSNICGIDEAGRGPLAGPVFAGCVLIPPEKRELAFWAEVTDSKKLSVTKREKLFPLIIEHSYFGIAQASNEEIDSINILQATLLSMRRAYEQMIHNFSPPSFVEGGGRRGEGAELQKPSPYNPPPASRRGMQTTVDTAFIDGNKCPNLPCKAEYVIGGDAKVLEIAAASILAKVSRDRFMAHIHAQYPMYGWLKNAGYGTKDHLAAIEAYGPSPHHRLTFAPLKQQFAA